MKRTTVWLEDTDREAIALIRERYGTASDSSAIRLALRILVDRIKYHGEETTVKQEVLNRGMQ